MPRDLQQSDRNKLTIHDVISGCSLTLFYRQPTTPEHIAYQKRCWFRKGRTMVNQTGEARAEFGEIILTGIGEFDFTCGTDAQGFHIFISSDPTSAHFRPDWKAIVSATAGDLLILLGMTVFEGSIQELTKADELPNGGDDETTGDTDSATDPAPPGERIIPLAANSNG